MTCPNCGSDAREGAVFCSTCGERLFRACPSCEAQNDPQARFCDQCGTPIQGEDATSPLPAKPTSLLDEPPRPGTLVGGRYQIRRFIGEGGKKLVYLANDIRLDRDVALALIKADGATEEELVRVRREARAMATLGEHPNIVPVHDFGDEGGRPFIVSQFMEGGDVQQLLDKSPDHKLPISDALGIARQICAGLAYAHSRNVIHRDIKPGNIWLSPDGTAKLGDFGLAALTGESRITATGMIVGTVAYLPPETAIGGAVDADARSDLYSFGCTLYELVTGKPPFDGDVAAVISQHINNEPVAPSQLRPDISSGMDALILRLLRKSPDERPESAEATLEAIGALVELGGSTAPGAHSDPSLASLELLQAPGTERSSFVGRSEEIEIIRSDIDEALAGHGKLTVLVGEPGIGKTRLTEEAATFAQLRGAQVLTGRCYEGEGAPAYWPWSQVIRASTRGRSEESIGAALGTGAGHIVRIAPELQSSVRTGTTHLETSDPDEARFRLFDALRGYFAALAAERPVVIILDDLHWSDKASLLLLQYLQREMASTRVMFLATYRDVALGRHHPLSEVAADLARGPGFRRIVLRGLDTDAVAEFIGSIAGVDPSDSLVEAVVKQTEGNPFFVAEVVRLLVDDGRIREGQTAGNWSVNIPQGVREVIGQHLNRLDEDSNDLLAIAAVIGREFRVGYLQDVSGLPGDRVLELLETAEEARVIEEVPGNPSWYRFSHALIRETLYDELPTTRRIRLHRQIGEALEATWAMEIDSHLSELAHHFAEAAPGGDIDKALDYLMRAARRANKMLAFEEAVAITERALELLANSGKTDPIRSGDLLLVLADAKSRTGDEKGSRTDLTRAVELAREVGDAELLGRAALLACGVSFGIGTGTDKSAYELVRSALDALPERDSAIRARLLARRSAEIDMSKVSFGEAREERQARAEFSNAAVAMAERIGAGDVLTEALLSRHWNLWFAENLDERLAMADALVAGAESAGVADTLFHALLWRFADRLELGSPLAYSDLERLTDMADTLGHRYFKWNADFCHLTRALAEGRIENFEIESDRVRAFGQSIRGFEMSAFLSWAIHLFVFRYYQGRMDEIAHMLRNFSGFAAEDSPLDTGWIGAMPFALVQMGRFDEARAEHENLMSRGFPYFEDFNWLIGMVFSAEAAIALRHVDSADTLFERLNPYRDRMVTSGPGLVCLGSTSRTLGGLALLLGDRPGAIALLEDAVEAETKLGMKPSVAFSSERLGTALSLEGGPDASRGNDFLRQAAEIFDDCHMPTHRDRVLATLSES